MEYLVVEAKTNQSGIYKWTTDLNASRLSAQNYFPNAEGIDVYENNLYFITKKKKLMYILDLDSNTYVATTTVNGLFSGEPDQIVRLTDADESLLYFTEDGGHVAGVHARDRFGQFFTILEGPSYTDETTGLSFSPDNKHLYVAYQDDGILFDVTRLDDLPFDGNTLNVKYHSMNDA